MKILRHELRQGRSACLIWTAIIGFLMIVCIFLFPEMKGEMEEVGDIFASMGSFTAAFGMDRLNIGTLIGFYGIECGNVLGLGGAFFAALTGVSMLAKEERDGTVEFLMTHPVSRVRVVTQKLIATAVQILFLNLMILGFSFLAMALVGEPIPWKEILLLHLAYFLLQLELAGLCFGISAFLRRGGAGVGLGLAVMAYFLNLIANLTDKAGFLRYVTPFAYCEAAQILTEGKLDFRLVIVGMAFMGIGIAAAYIRYCRKDLMA